MFQTKKIKIAKDLNASENKCIAFLYKFHAWTRKAWIYAYYDVEQKTIFIAPDSEVFVNNFGEIQSYDDGDFAVVDFENDENYPCGLFYKAARLLEKAGLITGQLECGTTELNRYRSC